MKAAKLTEHPSFRLMRQTDVQNVWHKMCIRDRAVGCPC